MSVVEGKLFDKMAFFLLSREPQSRAFSIAFGFLPYFFVMQEKGIVTQSVKEVVQSLVDDDLVDRFGHQHKFILSWLDLLVSGVKQRLLVNKYRYNN